MISEPVHTYRFRTKRYRGMRLLDANGRPICRAYRSGRYWPKRVTR